MKNDLTAVRQSHRSVVAYQRRLRDAMALFHREMQAIGFIFWERGPIRFGRPPREDNPNRLNDRWAHDLTMLYAVYFDWQKGEENKPGYAYLYLEHIADTGLEKARQANAAEPDSLKFEAASDADSILRCYWIVFTGPASPFRMDEWEHAYIQNLLKRHFKRDLVKQFAQIYSPQPLKEHSERGLTYGQMAVSLEDLSTPDSFRESFCNVITQRLAEHSPADGSGDE